MDNFWILSIIFSLSFYNIIWAQSRLGSFKERCKTSSGSDVKLCDPEKNLDCVESKCECKNGYTQHFPGADRCDLLLDYDEACFNVPCKPQYKCPAEGVRVCSCPVDGQVLNDGKCDYLTYGQKCRTDRNFDGCNKAKHFACINAACVCAETHFYVNSNTLRCDKRKSVGQNCDTMPCLEGPKWNVTCTNKICQCTAGNIANSDETCGPPSKLYDACNSRPPQCGEFVGSKDNMTCDPVSKTCQCEAGSYEHPGRKCGPPAMLHEKCDLPQCLPTAHLQCEAHKCVCTPKYFIQADKRSCGPPAQVTDPCDVTPCDDHLVCDPLYKNCTCNQTTVQLPGKRCGPPAKLHENCHVFKPYCGLDASWHLSCSNTSKKCICDPVELVEVTGGQCGKASKLDEICHPFPACLVSGFLQCNKAGRCECQPGKFKRNGGVCGPPSKYGESCAPPLLCDPMGNLTCGGQGVCDCTGINQPLSDGTCAPPGPVLYSKKCDASRGFYCKQNASLVCDERTGTCLCNKRWMTPEVNGGCIVRPLSFLNGPCQLLEDCTPGVNLVCDKLRCDCAPLYERDPGNPGGCRRRASKYGEPCSKSEDCLKNNFMICEAGRCTCDLSYDLDGGLPPCKFYKFNGRTFGQLCDNSLPVRRCVTTHNLECLGGICICLQDHVTNETSKTDPALGVVTCSMALGTQNHGDPCKLNAATIREQCDVLQGLGCQVKYEICACMPGYIPKDLGNNMSTCDPGKSLHGDRCDPPEVLVPKQPVDPLTGKPFPGFTSPPPPKFACNVSLNLACFKGKCACLESGVVGRYRLHKPSGKCLKNPGYSCRHDDECYEGKCIESSAAESKSPGHESHDHDNKLCAGLIHSTNSTSSVLTGSFVLILIYFYVNGLKLIKVSLSNA